MKKTAIITGASRGIGKAAAFALAECGYIPIINYVKSRDKAEYIAEKTGGIAFCADVSDSEAVRKMADISYNKFGGIDVLVNNAGISVSGLFNEISPEQEQRMIDVNIKGVFNCTRHVLPYMINAKYGRIINISSMWGEVGASCEVHYSAAKAAVIGFTKALAKEVGPSGITVNCITPGMIMTDMNSQYSENDLNALKDETPLGRLGMPSDIANAVSFLASDAASYITGQVLGINGGMVI